MTEISSIFSIDIIQHDEKGVDVSMVSTPDIRGTQEIYMIAQYCIIGLTHEGVIYNLMRYYHIALVLSQIGMVVSNVVTCLPQGFF